MNMKNIMGMAEVSTFNDNTGKEISFSTPGDIIYSDKSDSEIIKVKYRLPNTGNDRVAYVLARDFSGNYLLYASVSVVGRAIAYENKCGKPTFSDVKRVMDDRIKSMCAHIAMTTGVRGAIPQLIVVDQINNNVLTLVPRVIGVTNKKPTITYKK